MSTLRYLAFGSNLHPRRLLARTPSAVALAVVRLPGWRLAFHKRSHDGSGKCSLVETRAAGAHAYGVVYRLDVAERAALDRVEGVGVGYDVRTLGLPEHGEVFTYLAQPEYIDERLKPYRWYHRFVVEGARQHGVPAAYLERLQRQPCDRDPDRARAEMNAAILTAPDV